jgi:ABC-type transport system substrate-binding protein
MRKVVSLLLALFVLLALTACGNVALTPSATPSASETTVASETPSAPASPASPEEPKVLKVGTNLADVGNLDITKSTFNQVYEINNTICETLIGKNPKTLVLEPLLIESMPETSEDGTLFTFKLKKGILFHDGTELTTKDVLFTLNRFYQPATESVTSWLTDVIEGTKDVLDGKAPTLSGVKAVDDYTFTIKISHPYSAFLSVLAAAPFAIYPEAACKAAGDKWGIQTLIGTGPYKFDTFTPNTSVTLSKFDKYHGGAKSVDQIQINNMDGNTALLEYEAGNIDVCPVQDDMAPNYLNSDKYSKNIHMQPLMAIYSLILNQAEKPLDNPLVRQAVSLATDRKAITQDYLKGNAQPAYSFLPPGIPGYDEKTPELEYNVEKAKELLKQAGYANGITITATGTEGSKFINYYTILKEQYKKANINLEIKQIDKASWADTRSAGKVQFYIFEWYADFNDPDNFLYSAFDKGVAKFFSTGNTDEAFSAALAQGRTIFDPAQKQEFYNKLDTQLVREKFATVPLYYPVSYYLVSDRVKNAFVKSDFLWWWADAEIAG